MKIVQVIPSLNLAGAERMCETLSGELQHNGHEVVVITLYGTKTPIYEKLVERGINVIQLDKKPGLDLSMVSKLHRILKKEKPDVIHAHLVILKYVCVATLFQRVKTVHTVHSVAWSEGGRLDKMVTGFFYRTKKAIPVALNDTVKKTIFEVYGVPIKKIPIVSNGSDITRCNPKKDYSTGETLNVLHIGRFEPEKNHLGLLEAFELFLKMRKKAVLHLVGDGKCRGEIESYIDEHNLRDSVVLHGLQPDVYQYLNVADIFVLPSKYEGFPITLIEAMGTGLPIVASCMGGIPDVICDGKTGTLTSLNPKEIAIALARYADDEELRRAHGQNAREASRAFSSRQMAQGYEEIYNQVK